MFTSKFRRRSMILVTSTVAATSFITYSLALQVLGKGFDPINSVAFALMVGVFYFISQWLIHRHTKKMHRNVAVNEFL